METSADSGAMGWDASNRNSLEKSEDCGICGKEVANRGVLDCCQHVFCFPCIDNWASVTNLCPLCKLRFRLITCLPASPENDVTQEAASSKEREDDDLFPSFYIDEEAVTCLEGDKCLVRAKVTKDVGTDDTSVACDSCDRWYHAGCVGFDTWGYVEGSWWCPRCTRSSRPDGKMDMEIEDVVKSASELCKSAPAALEAVSSHGKPDDGDVSKLLTTTSIDEGKEKPGSILQSLGRTDSKKRSLDSATDVSKDRVEERDPRRRRREVNVVAGGSCIQPHDSRRDPMPRLGTVRPATGASNSTSGMMDTPQAQPSSLAAASRDIDLIEIVSDPDFGVSKTRQQDKADEPTDRENGIRTRIIMRRAEGAEPSLVEEVRQQMRSAAGYGAAADLGKVDVSDDRFFAAYKAAVAKTQRAIPQLRTVPKGNSWVTKAISRGVTVRENLTKKLYGGMSGRRTWDRDWEVAFWRGGRGNARSDQKAQVEANSPETVAPKIYFADGSLLPRKGELASNAEVLDKVDPGEKKPSAASSVKVQDREIRGNNLRPATELGLPEKPFPGGGTPKVVSAKITADSKASLRSDSVQGILSRGAARSDSNVPGGSLKKKVSFAAPDSLGPTAAGSAVPSSAKSNLRDKRQWALEVLARKTGECVPPDSSATSKVKKSLVDFLPLDLRPSVPIILSSKIPTAVRQAQLNRILGHQLKGSKVKKNPRGVECQQAIAAAVAKEQEIFDKSSSKGVYLNLCARTVSRSTKEKGEEAGTATDISADIKVRTALEAAGLWYDSDPDSPPRDLASTPSEVVEHKALESLTKEKPKDTSTSLEVPVAERGCDNAAQSSAALQVPEAACNDVLIPAHGDSSLPSCPMAMIPGDDKNDIGIEVTGGAAGDLEGLQPSPMYMDEDFGLEIGELEAPMLLARTVHAVQKDVPPKVRVVLTTLNKFKLSTELGGAADPGAESEKLPERLQGADCQASHGSASAENEIPQKLPEGDVCAGVIADASTTCDDICRNNSGGPVESTTGEPGCSPHPCVASQMFVSTDTICPLLDTHKDGTSEVVMGRPETSRVECAGAATGVEVDESSRPGSVSAECVIEPEVVSSLPDPPAAENEQRSGSPKNSVAGGDTGISVLQTEPREATTSGPQNDGNVDEVGEAHDWRKVGKCFNLESRIEEVRNSVLQKNTGMLTHFLTKYPTSDPKDPSLAGQCADTNSADRREVDNSEDYEGQYQTELKAANKAVQKQVHSYVREHLRPLFKSGVISAKEYNWAASKTTSKVMQHHPDAKSAAFLIVEGTKVKKLAEDYLQAFTSQKAGHDSVKAAKKSIH